MGAPLVTVRVEPMAPSLVAGREVFKGMGFIMGMFRFGALRMVAPILSCVRLRVGLLIRQFLMISLFVIRAFNFS